MEDWATRSRQQTDSLPRPLVRTPRGHSAVGPRCHNSFPCGAEDCRVGDLSTLELPVHIHKPGSAGGNRESVVVAVFPGYGSIGGDLDEFELDGLPCWNRGIQEPIREIGIEHGADGCIKCGAPISQFNGISGKKDEVANIGLDGVIYCESDWDKFRRQYFELNEIGQGPAG